MYGRKSAETLEAKRRAKHQDEETQFDFRPVTLKQSEDMVRRREIQSD